MNALTLKVLPELLSVVQVPVPETIPVWALEADGFLSITRTADELSVTIESRWVPESFEGKIEESWRGLQVAGTLDFSLTGILAGLTSPLAEAGISIFAISTYDTDYLLVKEAVLEAACDVLRQHGHVVE
ncbi:hypothetical protein CIG75_00590 [Tumebacillus algifaecis]|uniref:Aspartate kinase n=1 Tax=Tumebacillus algifaecis TaxID=1214604 RepID=A0A223CWE7_9BACL|nr:ACT domain-containing protein [Tumebacillus algifaecis]ASS73620.1 hypothetical protein CIG75_00590 [Tumebacillus algifaecis]